MLWVTSWIWEMWLCKWDLLSRFSIGLWFNATSMGSPSPSVIILVKWLTAVYDAHSHTDHRALENDRHGTEFPRAGPFIFTAPVWST